MRTRKLYESDAYISRFEADVISCDRTDGGYAIILDKTAFFPEGGGQPSDIGEIAGISVTDVQIKDGEIVHIAEKPVEAGGRAACSIDFARRFNFMQNHTAEHIVSGLVFKKFGYNNIGFHLNENEVTFDFNGFFTADELEQLELEANRRVWQNLKVSTYYPSDEELARISYRAKEGISGEIRLVEIENTDVCACCAPHVKSTGEIGIIKFLSTEKQHGGTRIFMKCGGFALKDYGSKNAENKAACERLSAKEGELNSAVEALCARLESGRLAIKKLNAQMQSYTVASFDKTKNAIFVENYDSKDLLTLADGLHKTYGGVKTALCEQGGGVAFVMCGEADRLEAEFQCLCLNFTVKGGGRGDMRQGVIAAPVKKIKEYFGV